MPSCLQPLFMLVTSLQHTIHGQTQQQYYTFDFDGQPSNWQIEQNGYGISTSLNSADCPTTSTCWQMLGGSSANATLTTFGYHTTIMAIDVAAEHLGFNEFCYFQYKTLNISSWSNVSHIITKSGMLTNYRIILPDNTQNIYIRFGNTASASGAECYFDNLALFGVPYTNNLLTTDPTLEPTAEPTLEPTQRQLFAGNQPTVSSTFSPTIKQIESGSTDNAESEKVEITEKTDEPIVIIFGISTGVMCLLCIAICFVYRYISKHHDKSTDNKSVDMVISKDKVTKNPNEKQRVIKVEMSISKNIEGASIHNTTTGNVWSDSCGSNEPVISLDDIQNIEILDAMDGNIMDDVDDNINITKGGVDNVENDTEVIHDDDYDDDGNIDVTGGGVKDMDDINGNNGDDDVKMTAYID